MITAIYARKSDDESDRNDEARSTTRQVKRARTRATCFSRRATMPTARTLSRFSGEHVLYEFRMLFATADVLTRHGQGLNALARNVFIEAFTVHLRAVVAFLYDPKSRPDDVISDEYVNDVARWHRARRGKPQKLRRAAERMNKQVGHLTRRRYRGNAPQKQWNPGRLAAQIRGKREIFSRHADPTRLHRDVRKFLEQL